MATKQEIAAIQARLMASYPNYHPADLAMVSTVWFEILGDIPGDLLKVAVMQYSSEAHEFAPSAGTIRDYSVKLRAKGENIPSSYEAFLEVSNMPPGMTKVREPFYDEDFGVWRIDYVTLKWSHPVVEEVARIIGWPKQFPTDNPGVDRAQFVKAYDAYISRFLEDASRLPQVKAYIGSNDQRLLKG